jgi:hypothetical protein
VSRVFTQNGQAGFMRGTWIAASERVLRRPVLLLDAQWWCRHACMVAVSTQAVI